MGSFCIEHIFCERSDYYIATHKSEINAEYSSNLNAPLFMSSFLMHLIKARG